MPHLPSLLLFVNYVIRVSEKDSGKVREAGGKERTLFATDNGTYDVKNRQGLSDKLSLAIKGALNLVFDVAVNTLRIFSENSNTT